MRRPRLRRALLWQLAAHGGRIPPAAAAQMVRGSVACAVYIELMDAILRDGPPCAFDGVTCPVLLAWGTRDRIIPSPRCSQRLRNLLLNAEWIELPGLSDLPMSGDPELVARRIAEFVGRVREPAAIGSPLTHLTERFERRVEAGRSSATPLRRWRAMRTRAREWAGVSGYHSASSSV